MLETVFYIIGLLLALYGLVNIIQMAMFHLLTSKQNGEQALFVRLENGEAEIELRAAVKMLQMYGSNIYSAIIAVDCGVDKETMEICRIISEENGCVILCECDDLPELIRNNFKEKIKKVDA